MICRLKVTLRDDLITFPIGIRAQDGESILKVVSIESIQMNGTNLLSPQEQEIMRQCLLKHAQKTIQNPRFEKFGEREHTNKLPKIPNWASFKVRIIVLTRFRVINHQILKVSNLFINVRLLPSQTKALRPKRRRSSFSQLRQGG